VLSAQQKPIDEDPKKPERSPYPKDFVRWYALDYFRRPGRFATRRGWVTFGTTATFALLSAATLMPALRQTHQAAPVSTAHAMFNQKCSNCHTETFAPLGRLFGCPEAVSIPDQTCNACHHGVQHHANASRDPSCVTCHREHAGHEVLARHVASRQCTECHGDLANHLKPGEKTRFNAAITSFNHDHPEFARSKNGQKDGSKVKFNHKAHLDLNLEDLQGLGSKMDCIQCHQVDDERRYMKPIQYDKHCARCHQLNVVLLGDFSKELKVKATEFSKTPLPHKEPAVVRAVLRDRLVDFAQKNAVVSSQGAPIEAPRPLPWKPASAVSERQWSWTMEQGKQAEGLLFMNKQWSKTEPLTGCIHCHFEKKSNERVDGLPVFQETKIPQHWHQQSVFSHGAHRMMSCTGCHDRNAAGVKVADSKTAEDVLLPTIQSCQECHGPAGSARNSCVECHRYHDRAHERDPNGALKLDDLLQKNR
jgi:hypothetical protein